MAKREAGHATLYDFRDTDIMFQIAESNGEGITAIDLADMLGFAKEDGGRPVGVRLAWMRKFGMVVFDDREHTWKLSRGGERVIEAKIKAPQFRVIEKLPDETMVDVMAHVTSRFQRGDAMLANLLRREFLFGTQRR